MFINNINYVAFITLTKREILRIYRIWVQSLVPPVMTMLLYFLIFGKVIGQKIGSIEGMSYIQFIIPGLMMMSIINNSYGNVVSSFFTSKFQKSIEELLIAPIAPWVIILGYLGGGLVRGGLVGLLVFFTASLFTPLSISFPCSALLLVILTSMLFSLFGLINAVCANSFDEINIIPTFVLTPLTYLGGVFYSMEALPSLWQRIALLNPIVYIISGFRATVWGMEDGTVVVQSIIVLSLVTLATYCFAYKLFVGGSFLNK